MITLVGKTEAISFLAGIEASFGAAIALGVGSTAAAQGDTDLASEVLRVPIVLRSPDFVNSTVIYKATVPAEVSGDFHEVALVKNSSGRVAPIVYGELNEVWTNGVQDATNSRFGDYAIRLNAATSGNVTASINVDYSLALGSNVTINYFVGSNVSSAYIRLRNNASNYMHYALPVTAGYNSVTLPLTAFTPTGAVDPQTFTSIVVHLASTAGGASQLHLDSVFSVDPTYSGDVLDRQVLSSPFTKLAGTEADIELPVEISI